MPARVRAFLVPDPELRPLSLHFVDATLEERYQTAYFRASLPYVRLAHLLGAALWILFWGFALIVVDEGRAWDFVLRFVFAVPITLAGLALTYRQDYRRYWKQAVGVLLILNAAVWSAQRILVEDARPDWGYAGMLLILAFTFVVTRVPFVEATIIGVAIIVVFHVAWIFSGDAALDLFIADYFLLSTAFVGMAGAYGLERGNRLLFLSERRVDEERRRADGFLANTLPRAIIERLHTGEDPRKTFIADGLPAVSVVFADLVSFTERSARISPEVLIHLLDDVFRRFDALASSLGLEKIRRSAMRTWRLRGRQSRVMITPRPPRRWRWEWSKH